MEPGHLRWALRPACASTLDYSSTWNAGWRPAGGASPPCNTGHGLEVCLTRCVPHWQPVARWRAIDMEHLNGTYLVHNGKEDKKVKVSSKMVGHKFGEFSFTRTKPKGGRRTLEVPPRHRRSSPPLAFRALRALCVCAHARTDTRTHTVCVHVCIRYGPGALGCAAHSGGGGWADRGPSSHCHKGGVAIRPAWAPIGTELAAFDTRRPAREGGPPQKGKEEVEVFCRYNCRSSGEC